MERPTHSPRYRTLSVALIALSLFATIFFGLRTYSSFLLLRSAYQTGKPELSSLRGWMTLDYVATTYRVPLAELTARLGLPPDARRETALKDIADTRGISRFQFVGDTQRALAGIAAQPAPKETNGATSAGRFADGALAALLTYGYPALAAVFLLGAIGLPLPTGIAAALAGSLAALGHLSLVWAAIIAVVASVAGDTIAYAIGRSISENFLVRHGRWVGYNAQNKAFVQSLFHRFGGATVILTRTLVSHLSSLVSLLAGIGGYRLAAFMAFTLIGRLIWTSAYLGLGYGVGNNLDAASSFMGNLTGLLLSGAALLVLAGYQSGLFARPPATAR